MNKLVHKLTKVVFNGLAYPMSPVSQFQSITEQDTYFKAVTSTSVSRETKTMYSYVYCESPLK